METDIDCITSNPLQSQPSPLSPNPYPSPQPEPTSSPNMPQPEPESFNSGTESHGLDPLFSEGDQIGVKRALNFGDLELDETSLQDNDLFVDQLDMTVTKKKRSGRGSGSDPKPKNSKRLEKMEEKARTEQLADFQRVMRERKGVGFKTVPMIEKPISSVLQKIRQRKLELSKKAMVSRTIQRADSSVDVMVDDDAKENGHVFEISDPRHGKTVLKKAVSEPSFVDISPCASHEKAISDDKPHSSNEPTSIRTPLREETMQPFHPPVSDTQDLFSDSQTSDAQDDQSNEEPSSPAEDIAPSLPSLNLKFDSAPPDDISSDEEETDKENKDPDPLLFKRKCSPRGDPVKDFVDEEALEDSEDELLKFQDEDEDEDADMEEVKDYIATDCQEKAVDFERRNELHQMWLQQQDEAGTENLLQRLKYGTEQREPSLLDNEDDGRSEDEPEEEDDDDTEDIHCSSSTRLSTKKLKQMIPHMFTDKDDGYVSSEDEDSQEILSKERLRQNLELKEQSKFISPAEDETSREVFSRIRKLNVVPETNKKQKSSSCLDSLLMKGGKNNSSKSSFLRRASSQPTTSSNQRQGPSTIRGFIFGRDDSNSRSSVPLPGDSSNMSQTEGQVKRSSSARFISSQTKHTEITRSETVSGASLFEILNRSKVKVGCDLDDRDNLMNDQVVFAAFKSVRKLTKIERK